MSQTLCIPFLYVWAIRDLTASTKSNIWTDTSYIFLLVPLHKTEALFIIKYIMLSE